MVSDLMNKQDKIFLLLFVISSLFLAGVVTENIRSVLFPQPIRIEIDVAKVKAGIEKAGITPHPALYGVTLK